MPTIHTPSTSKGKATRSKLLLAARKLAIENNGHVELAHVAQEANVVAGVVHRYFGSKSGLLVALVDEYYDRFHRDVMNLFLNDLGEWAVHERHRLKLGIQFHYEEPLSAVLHSCFVRDPAVALRESERIDNVIALSAKGIKRAQQRGELPDGINTELAGAAMLGAVQLVLTKALNRTKRPNPEELEEILWRQIKAAVGLPPTE